ncbi:transposase [Micromonospora maris]|uniref:transposase n=1 Tax=Micromonospora maris TaxID=1003110 RepID=UPI002E125D9C|nr:transposase [Micromonospora maris]WSK45193.1 transposase [Micromonospora maris]
MDRTSVLSRKDHVIADKKNAAQLPEPTPADVEFAQQLVERAKADGGSLVGPGGLLAGITRTVLESALGAELDAHLDEATGRRVNIRNGHGAKTVQTEVGPVRIQVPRDRAGSFTPRIVPKHSRRLDGFKEAIGVAVCQRADHRGDLGPAGGRV